MLYVTFEVQMDYEDLSVIRFNLLMFSFFLTCKDNAHLKHLSIGLVEVKAYVYSLGRIVGNFFAFILNVVTQK